MSDSPTAMHTGEQEAPTDLPRTASHASQEQPVAAAADGSNSLPDVDGTGEGEVAITVLGDGQEEEYDGPIDMDAARAAYAAGDAQLLKAIHEAKMQHPGAVEEHSGEGGDYVRAGVFGALDGIVTTFAIIAAVAGADQDIKLILLLGFANLLADGVSMGVGEYLSSSAELDMIKTEWARENKEYELFPEGEIDEMVKLYIDKGFEPEDAKAIIALYTKKPAYTKAFIDHMLVVELGHLPPEDDASPGKTGLAMFLSFLLFGSVPLWWYLVCYWAGYTAADSNGVRFALACVITGMALFALGAVKGKITRQGWIKSGALMLLNGTLATGCAYFIGWSLEAALGVSA